MSITALLSFVSPSESLNLRQVLGTFWTYSALLYFLAIISCYSTNSLTLLSDWLLWCVSVYTLTLGLHTHYPLSGVLFPPETHCPFHLLQVFIQMPSSQWGIPWLHYLKSQLFPTYIFILLSYFLFLQRTYPFWNVTRTIYLVNLLSTLPQLEWNLQESRE